MCLCLPEVVDGGGGGGRSAIAYCSAGCADSDGVAMWSLDCRQGTTTSAGAVMTALGKVWLSGGMLPRCGEASKRTSTRPQTSLPRIMRIVYTIPRQMMAPWYIRVIGIEKPIDALVVSEMCSDSS